MANTSIQGKLLEVTVTGCNNLMRTEWITKQDPYVYLEYGNQKFSTRVCKDGDKNPIFHDKFTIKLIEGIREIDVNVWNKKTLGRDRLIGSGNIQIARVLSEGHDDRPWPLLSRENRSAGEVKIILHYGDQEEMEEAQSWQQQQQQRSPIWSSTSASPTPTVNQIYSTVLPGCSYYCYTCQVYVYGFIESRQHVEHQLVYNYKMQPWTFLPQTTPGPNPPPSPLHPYWR